MYAKIEKHSLFDVVRTFVKRVKIFSMLDALETWTQSHHKPELVGTRQGTAGNQSLTLMRVFHGALIKIRRTDALLSKSCGGVGQGQSLRHAQMIPRNLPAKVSTACFVASPVHMAHAGARVDCTSTAKLQA